MLVMTDSGIHHLPVAESDKLVGILTLTDLSTALNKHPVYYAARIRRQANAAKPSTASSTTSPGNSGMSRTPVTM